MKLTRANLEIAKQAATSESRYTLQAVLVTPNETVTTDGHRLTRVTTPQRFAAAAERATFEPFCLAAPDALAALKRLATRKTAQPHETTVAIANAGESVTLTTEDAARNPTSSSHNRPTGQFPDFERVIPKPDKRTARVYLDPRYLRDICDHAISMQRGEKQGRLELAIYDEESAIRIDYASEAGQFATAVVMPLRPGMYPSDCLANLTQAARYQPGELVRYQGKPARVRSIDTDTGQVCIVRSQTETRHNYKHRNPQRYPYSRPGAVARFAVPVLVDAAKLTSYGSRTLAALRQAFQLTKPRHRNAAAIAA